MKKIVVTTVLMSLLTAGLMAGNKGLQVRDVLEANYTNEVTGKLVTKRANEIVENNVSDVKAQISSVLENGNRHIRFVMEEKRKNAINRTYIKNLLKIL